MAYYLAIDQSTSATKALLFDQQGRAVDRASREHRQVFPQPGWVEHDAGEIWSNTQAVLAELAGRQAAVLDQIVSLSITNQRETILVFDPTTGEPLHNAIVWQCRRGEHNCQAHAAAGEEPFIRRKTGLKIDPYFSASKLQWLLENKPTIRERLSNGTAVIGTIDTYLIHRITRGKVFATDTTNASRTLLFNLKSLDWDDELCSLWGVPRRALAPVQDSSDSFGETDLDGLLPHPIPIRGVMGDSHASLLANGCLQPGSAKATFGTGSSVLLNIGSKLRISESGVLTALAWSRRGVPTYAFEGIIIASASTLVWLRDQMRLAPDIESLEKLAREVPDNGGVHLVPAFSGLGLPYWDVKARAAVTGLSGHSDVRHVARAGFESIAFQLRDALDAMRSEAGVALDEVAADGGPTANAFLMQLTADIVGARLRVTDTPDGSALGAVVAGCWADEAKPPYPSRKDDDSSGVSYYPQATDPGLVASWREAVTRARSF